MFRLLPHKQAFASIGHFGFSFRLYSTYTEPPAHEGHHHAKHDTKKKSIPKLHVKWYYATDIPISKPEWFEYKKEKDPKKFIPFSDYDSKKLERRFQSLHKHRHKQLTEGENSNVPKNIVEVNEDKLFEVDIKEMTLSPVYWEGPIYEVRRGTWFNSDGIPLPNDISQAIEVGYHVKKPYLFSEESKTSIIKSTNQEVMDAAGSAVSSISKEAISQFNKFSSGKDAEVATEKDQSSKEKMVDTASSENHVSIENQKDIINLENGKLVLYCDEKYAAVFPDSMDSSFQIGVIRNFSTSPVSLISVEKIQRGYSDDLSQTIFDTLPPNPIPSLADSLKNEVSQLFSPTKQAAPVIAQSDSTANDIAHEKSRNMLEGDFDLDTTDSKADRKIDHLILCIHGIGQVLGSKYESIDFTHSINVLRNTMKDVYNSDDRYKKLAHPGKEEAKDDEEIKNTTIQVLPISWRHKIDFHPSKNFELFDDSGAYRLPKLSDINVDGVKSLRNITGDVALDILLYYEPHYINQVFEATISELNRVYALYKERNPQFNGKVHILGHSLGSAISFDILAQQFDRAPENWDNKRDLSFDVDSLFCVGSPVGVFKLLGQQNITARSSVPNDFNPRDPQNIQSSPKCENLYNIFHPCDPVGYRMEPLVAPKFANFKPEAIPFAVKGLNTQIKELASIGEGLQQKLSVALFGKGKQEKLEETLGAKKASKSVDDEDALGDILKNLLTNSDKKKTGDKGSSPGQVVDMREKDLNVLNKLNRSGRIDYCLPMGVFDISLVSAISAHVSYFEDKDTAGFVMKEVLSTEKAEVDSKKVTVYEKK